MRTHWKERPIQHGYQMGYSQGCRCDACKEAHRIANRRTEATRRARMAANGNVKRWVRDGTPTATAPQIKDAYK